jgi:RNA polymerase sigma-70 factor (ECF subfamily)
MHQMPDLKAKTDQELVQLALRDPDVFGALITKYEDRLKRYVLRISNCRPEDAEDILQEAFIKAYEHLNAYDQNQKFSSWMYHIVRNETISRHRKLQARAEGHAEMITDHVFHTLASGLDINGEAEGKETRETIFRVLDALDVKYREVLVLKFFEEKDYKEISFILKKPMGTIATLLNRAKKRFREQAKKMGIKLTIV